MGDGRNEEEREGGREKGAGRDYLWEAERRVRSLGAWLTQWINFFISTYFTSHLVISSLPAFLVRKHPTVSS